MGLQSTTGACQVLSRTGHARYHFADCGWRCAGCALPRVIYNWNSILALTEQAFEAGAAQFRGDVAVNPNDTEEAIWAFLCEARLHGADDARRQFLQVWARHNLCHW